MDLMTFLIFVGFILSGMICGFPIGYISGRKSVRFNSEPMNFHHGSPDVLDAEILEVKK